MPHSNLYLQVNRIKISTDKDNPLGFAKKLLDSASQTVTLSLLRPSAAMPPGNSGGLPLTPGLANTPISPLPGTLSMSINPLEHEIDRRLQYRKVSADSNMPLSLPISRPPYYKYTPVSVNLMFILYIYNCYLFFVLCIIIIMIFRQVKHQEVLQLVLWTQVIKTVM